MTAWADVLVAGLWRAGWAVLPVAAVVAGICRFGKCSPSTRHALWLTTLACLVAAMWLPGPTVSAPPPTHSYDEPVYFVGRQTPGPQMSSVELFVPVVSRQGIVERDSVKNKPAAPAQWAADTEPTPPRTAACSRDSSSAWLATTTDRLRRLFTFSRDCVEEARTWVCASILDAKEVDSDNSLAGESHESSCVCCESANDCDGSAILKFASAIGRPLVAFPRSVVAAMSGARNAWVAASATLVVPDSASMSAAPAAPSTSARSIELALAASGRVLTTNDPNLLDPPHSSFGFQSVFGGELRRYASGILGVRDAVGRVPPMPTKVWAFGFFAFAGVLVFRTVTAVRRLRRAKPADADTRRMVEREARRLGLASPPQAFLIDDRVSPMIWCGRQVRVILPQALWNEMDDDGRRAVVCHELAHLRRRDHWVRWIEIAVGCLYWWHPVMWWVRGKLAEEADACCDEWGVTWVLPRERRAYAEALLAATDFVSGSVGPQPLSVAMASARASKIARRLTMIMTATRRPGLGLTGVFSVLVLGALAWVATPAQSCPPEEQDATPAVAPVEAVAPVAVQTLSETEGPASTRRRSVLTGVSGDGTAPRRTMAWSRDPVAGGSEMADRLRQIEESQKRLSEELRQLSNALGRMSETTPAPRVASGGSTLFTAPTPMPSMQSTSPVARSPFGAVGMGSSNNYPAAVDMVPGTRAEFDQPIVSRFYKLSGDRLEALTEIMLREDVPVCVMQAPNGIQVNGTEAQQAVFAAFIKMITANEEAADIKLPEEKLEAVKKLAALESVPTKFVFGPDSISVQGSPAEQAVFDAFIALIHPKTPSGANRTPMPAIAPAIPAMPAMPAIPATPAAPAAPARAPRHPEASGMRTPSASGGVSATASLDRATEVKRTQAVERELAMNAERLKGLTGDQELAIVERTQSDVRLTAAQNAEIQAQKDMALKARRDTQKSEQLMLRSRVADLNAQRNQLEQLADHLEAEADAAESRAQAADKPEDSAKEGNSARQFRTQARQAQRDAARLDTQIERLDQALVQLEIDQAAGR